MTRNQKA